MTVNKKFDKIGWCNHIEKLAELLFHDMDNFYFTIYAAKKNMTCIANLILVCGKLWKRIY